MKQANTNWKAALLLAGVAVPSYAATVFDDDSGTDSLITNADNWDNGLPTGGNAGTLALAADYDADMPLIDYDITHTAGALNRVNGNGALLIQDGSIFRMNGATALLTSTRGINVNGPGASFVLDDGNADATNNTRDSAVNGTGSMTINGGTLSVGRNLLIQNGDITVNGGVVNVGTDLGARNFHSGGDLTLNGGAITATNLTFGTGGFNVTFGGSTVGSLVIDNFDGGRHDASDIGINFLTGSLMSMQLTAPVESGDNGDGDIGWMEAGSETGQEWAEALWADGRLTIDGQDFEDLGSWSTVEGTVFVYDDVNNTLSLIPEPSSLALLGLGGLCLSRRRRSI